MMTKTLNHKPGDKLAVFRSGAYYNCVIMKIASYVGKSGPGYYASYEPADPASGCSEFWTCDNYLRERDAV